MDGKAISVSCGRTLANARAENQRQQLPRTLVLIMTSLMFGLVKVAGSCSYCDAVSGARTP